MLSFRRKSSQNNNIDVVLSSSGVRAPCFIGGLDAIQEKGYNIHRIAGTSGGAIVASAFSLGFSIEDMREIARTIPYESFRDFRVWNLASLKNPSVYTGKALDEFYKSIFGDAQLKDFRIDCYISVVTIVGRQRVVLSKNSHPDLPVWKAVRMSSTIPFIFPYLELDGVPVTDGALVTSVFDIFPDSIRPTIALRPKADYALKRSSQDVEAQTMFLWNYLKILAEYFLDAVDNQHVPREEWARTISIPTFNIGGFSFGIKSEDVQKLIQYGYNSVILSETLPWVK